MCCPQRVWHGHLLHHTPRCLISFLALHALPAISGGNHYCTPTRDRRCAPVIAYTPRAERAVVISPSQCPEVLRVTPWDAMTPNPRPSETDEESPPRSRRSSLRHPRYLLRRVSFSAIARRLSISAPIKSKLSLEVTTTI